ncbi:MAG: D-aminoacyl-tRNA deacylase [Anaerolineae bacterium]
MRAILQRVRRGSVSVEGEVVGAIGQGLVVLVGSTHQDTATDAQMLARKMANLRIFEDEAGKMNLSALEVGAGVLVIPQFTLYADCRRGRRPSFTDAARPEVAGPLIEQFIRALRAEGISHVASGVFGAHMLVEIHNDGPVTIMLDTEVLGGGREQEGGGATQ